MNLVLCSIKADLAPPAIAGSNRFCRDFCSELCGEATITSQSANCRPESQLDGFSHSQRQLVASPALNASDWFSKGKDAASQDQQFGVSPGGNAKFARALHFINHLKEQGIADSKNFSNQLSENDVYRLFIKEELRVYNKLETLKVGAN